jgi:hypothetical protein
MRSKSSRSPNRMPPVSSPGASRSARVVQATISAAADGLMATS